MIFAEGQCCYVELLSVYVRQFFGQVDCLDVDFIEGLSFVVSIDQKLTNCNSWSMVGMIIEIYDYMCLFWACIGELYCLMCGEKIQCQTVQQIADQLMELEMGTCYQVLAFVVSQKKGEFVDFFKELQMGGYLCVVVDGETIQFTDLLMLKKQYKYDILVVVDWLVVVDDLFTCLTDLVETVFGLVGGVVMIDFVDVDGLGGICTFSEKLFCLNYYSIQLTEIELRIFLFNAFFGVCFECSGLGIKMVVDFELVIGDSVLMLNEGVVLFWNQGGKGLYFYFI